MVLSGSPDDHKRMLLEYARDAIFEVETHIRRGTCHDLERADQELEYYRGLIIAEEKWFQDARVYSHPTYRRFQELLRIVQEKLIVCGRGEHQAHAGGLSGVTVKPSKSAVRLLQDLAAGQTRIFYTVEQPYGWAQCEREGWATRIGKTDHAEITKEGLTVLSRMVLLPTWARGRQ